MENSRSNAPGYAHGFRPIEGDHPPPTPPDCQEFRAARFPGFDSLSATTPGDNSASQALSGSARASVDSSKKRRRLPGPLGLLQQGSISGRAGGDLPQHSGDGNDAEAASDARHQRRRGDASGNQPHGGVVGDEHFGRGAWISLCSALDMPIPQEGASDEEALHTYLDGATAPISGVLAGDFDLRVPALVAVIDSIKKLSLSDVVVDLVDPSGRIRGYLHPGCVEDHGPELAAGAAILLKEVSIFVSGPGCSRLLNIHPFCLLAIFAADTPLPNPERLEWLRACDPPFTPRHSSRPFESKISVGLEETSESGDCGIDLPRPTPVLQTTTSEQPPEQRATNPDSGSDRQRPIRKPPPQASPPKTRESLEPPETVNFRMGVARESAQERGHGRSGTGTCRETDASRGSVATAESPHLAVPSAKSVRRSPSADMPYADGRFTQPDERSMDNQRATHECVQRRGQAGGGEGTGQDNGWWRRGAQEEKCSQRSLAIRSGETDGSKDGSRDTPPEACSLLELTMLDPRGVSSSTPGNKVPRCGGVVSTSSPSGPMRDNVHDQSAAAVQSTSTARRSSAIGTPQIRINETKGAPACGRADSLPGKTPSATLPGARDPSRKDMDTAMASAKSTSTSIWTDLEGLMSDDDDGQRINSDIDSDCGSDKRSAVPAQASIRGNAQGESREVTTRGSKGLIQNASQGEDGDCLAKASRSPGIGRPSGSAHGPAQTISLGNEASLVGRASDASQAMATQRSPLEPPRKIVATEQASQTSVTSETSVGGGSSLTQSLGRSSFQYLPQNSPSRGASRAGVGGIRVFQMDDDILDAALDDSD